MLAPLPMTDIHSIPSLTIACVLLAGCSSPGTTPDTFDPELALLAGGAELHGANGMHFGPDGQLYVASVLGQVLVALDPETGATTMQWGNESGVAGPDDVAFAPDGTLYWTDLIVGNVGMIDGEGTASVIASPGPGTNPVTVSDDGRVFVSQCFLATNLYEIDPSGVMPPRLVTDQLGPGCGLNGMDFGPDGLLYGPRWFAGTVVRVDVDAGTFEDVASGFGTPAAVKFDSQGRLHVLDTLAAEVVRIDLMADTREVVATLPQPGLDNLAFDADDRLYVSSYADGSIVEVTGLDTQRVVRPAGMVGPGGLALLPDDAGPRLFVADFFSLRELDATSGEELGAVRDVVGVTPLGSVMSVHAHGDHLLTSSWFDNKVAIWDPNSASVVEQFTDFAFPVDALPWQDGFAVSSYGTGEVLFFTSADPSVRTPLVAGLSEVAGLAATDDHLYVAERGGGRILEIADASGPLASPRVVVEGLAAPEGMVADAEGDLFVVEVGAGRVIHVDAQQGTITTIVGELALGLPAQGFFPSTMLLSDLALDGDTLYVSVDLERAVYRITLR